MAEGLEINNIKMTRLCHQGFGSYLGGRELNIGPKWAIVLKKVITKQCPRRRQGIVYLFEYLEASKRKGKDKQYT